MFIVFEISFWWVSIVIDVFSTVYFRFWNYQNTEVIFKNIVSFSFPMKKYESGGAFHRSFPTIFIPVPEWSESLRDDGKKDKSCNSSCQSALLTIIQEEGYWLAPVPLPAEWFRRNRHLFRTSARYRDNARLVAQKPIAQHPIIC